MGDTNEEQEWGTGSVPTDAKQQADALRTQVLLEAARRRQEGLPGLLEVLQDQVLVTSGATTRGVHGLFCPGTWRLRGRQVHELFVNASSRLLDTSIEPAERTLVTLLHEASHVWAQANGIRDTSRDGRYHNRRFGQIALQIGLEVERDSSIGHRTPRLSDWARAEYSDLLTRLGQGPELDRVPTRSPVAAGTSRGDGKYVFATCSCLTERGLVTIRVAAGSWRLGAIRCGLCVAPFAPTIAQ